MSEIVQTGEYLAQTLNKTRLSVNKIFHVNNLSIAAPRFNVIKTAFTVSFQRVANFTKGLAFPCKHSLEHRERVIFVTQRGPSVITH